MICFFFFFNIHPYDILRRLLKIALRLCVLHDENWFSSHVNIRHL